MASPTRWTWFEQAPGTDDGQGRLEKEMATHFGVLAWRIPGTEEPGGLQSMGSAARKPGVLQSTGLH